MSVREILAVVPYFADLDPGVLDEVAATSELLSLDADEALMEEGDPSDAVFVLVEGEVVVSRAQQGHQVELGRRTVGEFVGEMGLLDRAPRMASVAASMPSQVVRIRADAFERLLSDPVVARRMFFTAVERIRQTEAALRHGERMAALGQMAAQLMHELNNPAAAIARSAQELDRVERAIGDALAAGSTAAPPDAPRLTPLELADRIDEVSSWLEGRDVDGAWELGPELARDGWTVDLLEQAAEGSDAAALRLLGLRAAAAHLLDEIRIGAGRVSELVRVVKDYSYVDQAPVQSVEVTGGIEDTLVLLRHRLGDIEVVTAFDDGLPMVDAPGRDLNQVWTNLLANAADAMGDSGTLKVTATASDGAVVVSVADTGSGVPDDVLPRIFDPFFTTKQPGEGTGLGLHTVHTIVTRLGGTIDVDSSSAGTTFTVTIPAVAP